MRPKVELYFYYPSGPSWSVLGSEEEVLYIASLFENDRALVTEGIIQEGSDTFKMVKIEIAISST